VAKQAAAHSIRVPLKIRTPKDREKIESTVESLIAILDEEDGDCDLEPSLADNGGYGIPTGHDLEHDPADDEPELGWTADGNQERALRGMLQAQEFNHRESEHDGREPSLGSVEGWSGVDQTHWASGDRTDREMECEDEGAEHDGREPRSTPFELVQDPAP
jgi:hypothetical protein